MATFGALRGVRFGRRERALLLQADPPGSQERPDSVAGLTRIVGATRSERQSLFRAARRLDELGLVTYWKQLRGKRGVYIELTPLGAELVERYKRELTEGQRIRWPRDEEI